MKINSFLTSTEEYIVGFFSIECFFRNLSVAISIINGDVIMGRQELMALGRAINKKRFIYFRKEVKNSLFVLDKKNRMELLSMSLSSKPRYKFDTYNIISISFKNGI